MLPHFLTQHPSDTTTLPSAQQPKSIRVSQAAFISSASVAENAGSPRSASISQWEKFKRNLSAFFVRNVSIPLAKLFAINRAIAAVSNNTDSQVNVHINATINNKGEQAIDHYKKALEIVKTPLNLLHLQGSFDFQEPSANHETELRKLSIGIIKQRLSQFSLDSLRENFFPKLDLEDLRDLYDATYSLPLDRENAEKLDQLNKYLNQAIAERTFSLSVKTFLNSAEKPAGDNTPNIEVDYQKLQNVAKAYLNAKRENINLEQLPEFQRFRTFMQQKIKEIDLLRLSYEAKVFVQQMLSQKIPISIQLDKAAKKNDHINIANLITAFLGDYLNNLSAREIDNSKLNYEALEEAAKLYFGYSQDKNERDSLARKDPLYTELRALEIFSDPPPITFDYEKFNEKKGNVSAKYKEPVEVKRKFDLQKLSSTGLYFLQEILLPGNQTLAAVDLELEKRKAEGV